MSHMTLNDRLAYLRTLAYAHTTTEGAFAHPALAGKPLDGRAILTEALSIISELQQMAHVARSHISDSKDEK